MAHSRGPNGQRHDATKGVAGYQSQDRTFVRGGGGWFRISISSYYISELTWEQMPIDALYLYKHSTSALFIYFIR